MAGVVELLEELVRVPSPSGEEAAAVAFLAEWLAGRGLEPVVDGRNVWCAAGPQDGPTLLLCSHLDTVPVGDGWTRPPLAAAREGERIYGRGSNDAKGCVAAMATALADLVAAGALPGRVLLAATCEEETGRPGGLVDLLPRLPRFDAAVVGEPTGLVPVRAQKGMLVLEATAHGRQAHAARPEEGDNALVHAARAVLALDALRFERVHPELGAPTCVVTVLRGGERRNVIPGSCALSIDVRTTPDYSPAELRELIQVAAGPKVEVAVRSERYLARATDPDDPIIAAALTATGAPRAVGSPTCSDWAFIAGSAVKLGPGESPRSHQADEYVTVPELERGVAVYRALIEEWFARAGAPPRP